VPVERALRRQREDPDDHDLGLIVERLARTPEERLLDLQSMLKLLAEVRPDGPLVDWVEPD